MDRPQAAEMLYEAERARTVTRRARRAAWFPLLVFGVVTLAATPLYRQISATGHGTTSSNWLGPVSLFAGGFFLRSPSALSLYWLIALPAGYAATAVYLRRRAQRDGVASPVWAYVGTGLALILI